jgi:hypothetical protein
VPEEELDIDKELDAADYELFGMKDKDYVDE